MKFLKIFSLFFFALFAISSESLAKVSISIKNDNLQATKILFLGFDVKNHLIKNDVEEIYQRITRNLLSTGLYTIITESSLDSRSEENIENSSKYNLHQELTIGDTPDFERYNKQGVDCIIIFDFLQNVVGNLEIRVRMWNILDRQESFAKGFTISKENYRKTANLISNAIYVASTQEQKGHFASQILYISESGNFKKRIKKISVIDFDGENYHNLTDGSDTVLTPVFSKKAEEIYYLRYFQGRPQIFSLNVRSGKNQKVGGYRGTTLAPSCHPQYQDVILLTAIEDGNSDIHQLDIANNIAKRLTKSNSIDTTASYSPDGKYIVFSSDREGNIPQIYKMTAEGAEIERISKGEGSYAKPQWSPDGKFIAFTKISKNKFSIGIMSSSGRNEKILVSAYLVEGARWSPSGRYLIYSKKKGPFGKDSIPRLFIIDVITNHEFELPTPENEGATDPDWI